MHHAIGLGHNLNKSPKVGYAHHFASINTAQFNAAGHAFDHLASAGRGNAICRSNKHAPIIFDIDLDASFILNPANVLATRANDGPDLRGVNLDHHHAWGMGFQVGAGLINGFEQAIHNRLTAFFGLRQGFF